MTDQTPAEQQLAQFLVQTLNLEDITAEQIDPEETLFGDGLALDSIDALELAMAISQNYGVQIRSENENVREAFASLRSLSQFIDANKAT